MNLPKTVSRRACVFVLLALIPLGASLQGAPEPVDPLVGNWLWNQDHAVAIRPDGTARSGGSEGTWQYLQNPEVQRHYRIVWEHGKYIDEVVCSEDGQRAHVRNQNGEQYNVRRALDDKPSATSHAPTSATAQPTAAEAVDPIVGEWGWLKGQSATFLADGTVKSGGGSQGSWEFLHNPEAERKYRVTLRPGKYVSDFVYDPATRTGRATNSEGKFFPVVPKTATPDKPEGYFGTSGH